jgi:hypothetical protein
LRSASELCKAVIVACQRQPEPNRGAQIEQRVNRHAPDRWLAEDFGRISRRIAGDGVHAIKRHVDRGDMSSQRRLLGRRSYRSAKRPTQPPAMEFADTVQTQGRKYRQKQAFTGDFDARTTD